MGAPSDIKRFIELGLSRYGAGDLDGALLMWEEALAIDPDNAQAHSYIDYVRLHYAMLSSEPEVSADEAAPFGIEEEPEYQIEVTPGELEARDGKPVLADDLVDAGWFDEPVLGEPDARGEATAELARAGGPTQSTTGRSSLLAEPPGFELLAEPPPLELEVEAEPPPLEVEAEPPPLELLAEPADFALKADLLPSPAARPATAEGGGSPDHGFEDATREYYGTPAKPTPPPERAPTSDFSDTAGTTEYQPDSGRTEFESEHTGGFGHEGSTTGFSMQETEVRKRNFGFVQPVDDGSEAPAPVQDRPSSPLSIGLAPTVDVSMTDRTRERTPFAPLPDEDELLASLPRPQAAPPGAEESAVSSAKAVTRRLGDTSPPSPKPPTKEIPAVPSPSRGVTKDFPEPSRVPARRDSAELSQAEVMLTHARTQDFDPSQFDVSAPTRELGLRPKPASGRPGTLPNPVDEDAPTKQSDVRAIRSGARTDPQEGAQPAPPESGQPAGDGTRSDIVLPFDPIDARAAQILDEIDADAPANEDTDAQTRRRIGALLERAVAWNQAGDTERAVAAVDLALSEDPNSALAQKLITRHRETILSVFQGYLGDLERIPQLARPLEELEDAPIGPRAAFLLSRVDGMLTIDELLDVSGMPRLEAYRHLCQLYLRGILR